ncbi:Eno2 [Symbiodinium natans]|uniref:Eno2 protein n=1 Tax=Symbiodinium natans TaxID=878477 RepID=A0A812QN68_9DINO|nr:Eno2 [Symbiodinium natans]
MSSSSARQLSDNLRTGVSIVHWLIEGAHSSVLTFSSPVTDLLSDGDAIYIEPSSIRVDGQDLAALSCDAAAGFTVFPRIQERHPLTKPRDQECHLLTKSRDLRAQESTKAMTDTEKFYAMTLTGMGQFQELGGKLRSSCDIRYLRCAFFWGQDLDHTGFATVKPVSIV